MALLNNSSSLSTTQLVIYHEVRRELTQVQDELLTKRLEAATVSPEAMIVFDEMRVQSIETIANTYFNPENPVTYAAMIMEARARVNVLTEILDHFRNKIR